MHKSVLLNETIEKLDLKKGDVLLDCTINGGGHSREVCRIYGRGVRIIGLDMDNSALRKADKILAEGNCNYELKCMNFRNLDKALDDLNVIKVDKMIFDLGLSSGQLDLSGRGFSFKGIEPLQMTFEDDPSEDDLRAVDIVNDWDRENIELILKNYGEERFAREISKAIEAHRERQRIETTDQLVALIKQAVPAWYRNRKKNVATKTFQALRIAVNDEISALKEGLEKGFDRLKNDGRIAVISFHSLEDRIVKNFFKGKVDLQMAKFITKKPITPSDEELKDNPRSRSAKLRVLEKTIN